MGDIEEYFPRGGKKPTTTRFAPSGNFLGEPEKGEKKKKKSKEKSEGDDGYLSDELSKELDQARKNCAIGLSYQTVKEGTLLLGRVRQVLETKIFVNLPCRMSGCVMACHVSEPHNKQLEAYVNDQIENIRELPQMFRPGQYVAVKVLEVNGENLLLSMMPQHVNSAKTHVDLVPGALLQAAVSSVEDHGFLMDIGIANTRAFLPKANVNPEINLDVGVLTWCCVKSISPSSDNSVVTLSNVLEALQGSVHRKRIVNVTNGTLLPGTAVEFIVDKPLDNGIEGQLWGSVTAYIQRQHADKWKGKKPNLGQKIRARVLYVMPTRNTPFLTMKGMFDSTYPDLAAEQEFQDGDIIEDAQVLKITGRSVHFKLGARSFGTMSLRRVQVQEDLTDEDMLAKSYPIGSVHEVRVLCYQLSDHAYSVSDEAGVLRERYWSARDLAPGDEVRARITALHDSQAALAVGRIPGIVPRAHMSDAGIYLDPKKATTSKLIKTKYKVGQEVSGRVLFVDEERGRAVVTLKPSLLSAELDVLSDYGQALIGKAYTGTIKAIRDYVLVSFFNKVTAFVPRHYASADPDHNLLDVYHLGQIVNCTILKVDVENKKMTGSLTTTPFWPEKKRESKKRPKTTDETEIPKKKKKSEDNAVDTEQDKKKKKKKDSEELKKDTEESDAIETDIQEDDNLLTPTDLHLLDLSDCDTGKKYKKRVVSLIKSIKARTKRLDTIEKKIANIESKGLHAKNKKYHTAMHMDKLQVEERLKLLLVGLNAAQEKLKEFDLDELTNKEYKKLKEDKKAKKEQNKKAKKESKKRDKKKKKNTGDMEVEEEVTPVNGDEDESSRKKEKKNIKVLENAEPVLDVPSAKDFWSENAVTSNNKVATDESSSSEDEEKEQPKKKRKKLTAAEKVSKAREEEERLRETERRAIESESEPRSSEQFERALLANPDCSQLWIAYMAFHLQATEIEKARAVARKALQTISFREEQEKLNVWLALLNVENRFGTKETLQKTLEEAVQMNDPFKVHSKLLDMYVEVSKPQELVGLVDLMQRKYRRLPETYTLCAAACYDLGLVEKARQLMQKGIAVLDKKEHVGLLVKFALLERSKNGEGDGRERSEALFEQVLAVYPQRVDVCAVYVDALRAAGHLDTARQLLERMTSQKLPARKMKILYRKWIEIEEKHGDAERVDDIRQRALQFIDKAKF